MEALRIAENQIRAELQRRELDRVRHDAEAIRTKCREFAQFVRAAWHVLEPNNPLLWNWHLDAMCQHLQAISRGLIEPRLIINVPPGSSKSMIVSVLWQAWEWGPCGMRSIRFLSTSYEEKNVTRDTRKTRDLIMSEWFQALWPDVKMVRAGETSFANSDTGSREGTPFSAITGKRGDRFIIDDPHSLDGAESETERDKAVRRFIEGGQNRLNDQTRSAIVVVMQRLHENDLTGALLGRSLGYVHIMIPMEFEPSRRCQTPLGWADPRSYDGELMDPRRMPPLAIERLKEDNDYMWAGQYQQRPAPREGGMFKVDKIVIVDAVPAGGIDVRGWDIAGSTRKKSPFTVGGKLRAVGGLIYITHVARARAEIAEAEQLIVDTIEDDGLGVRQSLPQDPGSAGKSQKFHISVRLLNANFTFSPETGKKEDRAIPFASQVNAGNVRMVRGPWNDALFHEMRNFPNSTFKDQIDALSRSYMELAKQMKVPARSTGGIIAVDDQD